MDSFVRGLSKKSYQDFRSRELEAQFVAKHEPRSRAHKMELARAKRFLAHMEVLDDGTDFVSIRDQWKDEPLTLVELQEQSNSVTGSLAEVSVPFTEVIGQIQESYYLRNLWRWIHIVGRDLEESQKFVDQQHAKQEETVASMDFVEGLFSKNFFARYTRD